MIYAVDLPYGTVSLLMAITTFGHFFLSPLKVPPIADPPFLATLQEFNKLQNLSRAPKPFWEPEL